MNATTDTTLGLCMYVEGTLSKHKSKSPTHETATFCFQRHKHSPLTHNICIAKIDGTRQSAGTQHI